MEDIVINYMFFLNGKILKLYIYLCYLVINYFFEVFILILGICWLFFFVYDFMVFKIDLKFLKLRRNYYLYVKSL